MGGKGGREGWMYVFWPLWYGGGGEIWSWVVALQEDAPGRVGVGEFQGGMLAASVVR